MSKVSMAQVLPAKPSNHDGQWLSVSKVKTFKGCPAQFQFSYIQKLPRKTWSHHIFGSFLHEVLELFHKERLDGNVFPDHKLMTKSFKDALNNFKEINSSQKKEAAKICNHYLEKLAIDREEGTTPEILGVEDSFYIDIDGKVLLNGFIDLVKKDTDGTLHVADYKTSKRKTYLQKDFLQLKTYAYVKCVEDPSIEKIRASYIMLRHNFDHITKDFSREEVMSMEESFMKYADEIAAEKLWRPNPTNLCSYCSFLEKCDAGQEFVREKNHIKHGAVSW